MYLFIFTYNHEKYISECLKSAIFQTENFKEIIIIDDKSNDNTVDIIKSISKYKKNIFFFQNQNKKYHENTEFIYSYLKLESKRNSFFSIISGDDKLELDYVSTFKKFILENKKINFFFSAVNIINQRNEYLTKFNSMGDAQLFKKNDLLFKSVFYHRKINSVPFVFNSKIALKKNLLKQMKNSSYDYETLINITHKYNVFYINKYLAYWRRHDKQESFKKRISQYKFDFTIFKKYENFANNKKEYLKYYKSNNNFKNYLLALHFYNNDKMIKFYKFSFKYIFNGNFQILNLLILLICMITFPFSNKLYNFIRRKYLFK